MIDQGQRFPLFISQNLGGFFSTCQSVRTPPLRKKACTNRDGYELLYKDIFSTSEVQLML